MELKRAWAMNVVGKLASYGQNGRRSINNQGISLLSHCFFRFQLDNELHIVYMNTLKVGYISKAHHFTSQIVSQMWVASPVTNKIHKILLWRTQRGTSGWFLFRKNLDISCQHIYLGHPLKLNGVWAYIILGDFTGATPICTCCIVQGFMTCSTLSPNPWAFFFVNKSTLIWWWRWWSRSTHTVDFVGISVDKK